MAAPVGSELQVAAPVGSESQMAAPVGLELQMAALTPPQNIDCEEDCVVDEIAPEKDVQVQKLIKEIKENYPDAEVLENAVHRMNKAFMQSPNSYIKRLKKRTGRKTTQTAEYHYTLLTKQPRKAAELNVLTFNSLTSIQFSCSVDCGVIVCYLMNRISRNKEIDQKLSREQCTRFRAKMAVKLLTDRPRSWSPEDNENAIFDI
ncbi:hypothetical protein RHGRI_003386 [Rhododendron griersonianum]|uniref:Uncharacterized protein n=1 Tax=Rhododendron griersonianum TaxID=479676 RepID=A0AAV6L5A9_9ERIC|nr:hypothetical protein RHGRI_003386 [Rhododendron griersonianum]